MDIDEIRSKLIEVSNKQFKMLRQYEKYKAKADEAERKLRELEKLHTDYRQRLIDLQLNTIKNTTNAVIHKVV